MRALSPEASFDILDLRDCFKNNKINSSCIDPKNIDQSNTEENIEEVKYIDLDRDGIEKNRMFDFKEYHDTDNEDTTSSYNSVMSQFLNNLLCSSTSDKSKGKLFF